MTRCIPAVVCGLVALGGLTGLASAQSASINLAGVQLRNNVAVNRDSAPQTIAPAPRYRIQVSAMVHGSPFSLLGTLFSSPTSLAQVMEQLSPGSSAALDTISLNPTTPPTHPFTPTPQSLSSTQVIAGTTVTFAATIASGIRSDNVAFFSLSGVTLTPSLVGYLIFDSGTASITRIPCPPDADGNGQLQPADVAAFVGTWFTSITAGTLAGDYNLDGAVAPSDVAQFVGEWFTTISSGGCPL